MNTVEYVRTLILPASLALLPEKMTSPEARALVMTIGLQESQFLYRLQIGGPARGFWQFERGGVQGTLQHAASRPHILAILNTLGYNDSVLASLEAIADNDVLACVYARLLLWTSPLPLPKRDDSAGAWLYYISCWRPGKPRMAMLGKSPSKSWNANYAQAWESEQ